MKRILAVLLLLCLLPGCTYSDRQDLLHFYYPTASVSYGGSQGVLGSEDRDLGSHREDLKYLVTMYLSGPADKGLRNGFPADVKLLSCEIRRQQVRILLSGDLDSLSPLERTLACAGLAKTVLEESGMTSVRIATEEGLLSGDGALIFDTDSLLLADNASEMPEEE